MPDYGAGEKEIMNFEQKTRNCALQTRNFVFKTRNFASKMVIFAADDRSGALIDHEIRSFHFLSFSFLFCHVCCVMCVV